MVSLRCSKRGANETEVEIRVMSVTERRGRDGCLRVRNAAHCRKIGGIRRYDFELLQLPSTCLVRATADQDRAGCTGMNCQLHDYTYPLRFYSLSNCLSLDPPTPPLFAIILTALTRLCSRP